MSLFQHPTNPVRLPSTYIYQLWIPASSKIYFTIKSRQGCFIPCHIFLKFMAKFLEPTSIPPISGLQITWPDRHTCECITMIRLGTAKPFLSLQQHRAAARLKTAARPSSIERSRGGSQASRRTERRCLACGSTHPPPTGRGCQASRTPNDSQNNLLAGGESIRCCLNPNRAPCSSFLHDSGPSRPAGL